MAVISTLSVQMDLDASGFNTSMDAVGRKLRETGASIRQLGSDLTTRVTAPIVAGFTASVFAASNLNETLNKTNVVFGDAAADVVAWSEDSATAFGMSQNEALGYASTLGNIFTSMGMAGDQAGKLSTDIVALGADLGSFNNVPTADALEAIRAGLLGEYEPLRRFGIVLDDASVKAKAVEMGLADANGEISAQNMVLARQALIAEGATNAQGDFAETSGSLANQMKILRARLTNAAAAIGQILLPYVTRLAGWVSGLIDRFDKMSNRFKVIVVVILAVVAAIGPLLVVIGTLVGSIGVMVTMAPKVKAFMTMMRAGTLSALGPLLLIAAAIAAIYFIWTRDLFGIRTKLTAWFDAFKAPGGQLDQLRARFEKFKQTLMNLYKMHIWKVKAAIDNLKVSLAKLWDRVKGPLAQFARLVGSTLVQALRWAMDNLYRLQPLLDRVGAALAALGAMVSALVRGDWQGAWDAFKDIVENAALAALEAFRLGWEAIKGIASRIDWGALVSGAASLGYKLLTYVDDLGLILWGWAKAGATYLAMKIGTLWDEHKDKLAEIAMYLVNHIDDVGAKLWDWLKIGAGYVADLLGTLWDEYIDDIAALAMYFVSHIDDVGAKLLQWLADGAANMVVWLGYLWNAHKDEIKKLAGWFVDLMIGLGGKLVDWAWAGAKFLAGKLAGLWDDQKDTIKQLPGRFIAAAGPVGAQLWAWAKTGASYLAGKASTLWDDNKAKLAAIPGALISGIGSLGGVLYDWIKSGASNALETATTAGSELLTTMSSIGTRMGTSIKNGFNNALSGIGGFLVDKMNGIIDGINRWIRSANSKIPFGDPIPEIPRIGGSSTPGQAGGGAGGGGFSSQSIDGGFGGAQVVNATITINVTGVDSPKAVAQEVYSTFARELGLKGAV